MISSEYLDETHQRTVRTLRVMIQNVGLGPAMDLELHPATEDQLGTAVERRAVWRVDQAEEIALPLSDWEEPATGFRHQDFKVVGTYTDRTEVPLYDIVMLGDAGLRDVQLEAARLAALRADLAFISGTELRRNNEQVVYDAVVANNGLGSASEVSIVFRRSADFEVYETPVAVPDIGPSESAQVKIELPAFHPWLSCVLCWTDGAAHAPRSRIFERIYPSKE